MKVLRFFLVLVLASLCGSCAQATPRSQHVFIVSFDGGKPEVMQRSPMPLFFEMAKTGAATMNAQTVFPSITLVAHTSMLTGVVPAKHGVNWNDWIPSKGLIEVRPFRFGAPKRLHDGALRGQTQVSPF